MAQQPLIELGGSGPVMHIALANGFPPLTYRPLFEPFMSAYRVVSLPPRGLWPRIEPPPENVGTWREVADDLLAGLRHYDLENVIAIGHSFGAIASMLAVIDEPARFRAIIMLDPTMLPPKLMDAIKDLRKQGDVPRFPLVEGAQNRRHRFPNLDEAYDYWRGKPLFNDWSDDAVRLYAESLTQPAADGDELELAWSREWEAYYYMAFYADTWDDIAQIKDLLPTLIIRAGNSDAYLEETSQIVQDILPTATHVTLPGYGHLFPQAAPDATYKIIAEWLNENELSR